MNWEAFLQCPAVQIIGVLSALASLIMFVAWVLGPLRRWWRRRSLDPQKEIPRLFEALEQVAKEFGIPIRESLLKNGQPLSPAATKDLQSITRQLESFAQAITLSAQEYFEFGNAYHALQQFELAIEKYDISLTLLEHPRTFNNRAVAYAKLGQHERAIHDYDKALELKPDDLRALVNRGIAYACLEQYQRAIQDYDEAIALKSDYAEAFYNRGVAYYRQDQYDDAAHDIDVALEHDPNLVPALIHKANYLIRLGEPEKAIGLVDKAIAIDPTSGFALYNRGYALLSLGHPLDAIEDLKMASQYMPPDARPHFLLARAQALLRRPDEALAALEQALRLEPGLSDALPEDKHFDNIRDDPRFRALVYGEDERTASERVRDYCRKRRKELSDYLSREPDDAEARYKIAEYQARLLDNASALHNLERAVELDEGYREKAKKSSAFRKLQRDLRFRKLIYREE